MTEASERLKKLKEANALVDKACEIYKRNVCGFMGCASCFGSASICPYRHIQQSNPANFTREFIKNLKEYYLTEIGRL
jgi:hypothetical protein